MTPRALACLIALTPSGCDQVWRLDRVELGGPMDAGIDSPPDATRCYGTGVFRTCLPAPLANASLMLGGIIDTDTDDRCIVTQQLAGPDVCLFAAGAIVVGDDTIAAGTRPLVLVADTSITISALLDVSSTQTRSGAGHQTTCGSLGNGADNANGGGGGAGGTSAFPGGGGQAGAGGSAAAGAPSQVLVLDAVRGSCHGFSGGVPVTGVRAAGGAGGGAVFAIARDRIVVAESGRINASGAGGHGGIVKGGGGGGGAGGLIGLDAPVVTIMGEVLARGGGGGGGGSATAAGSRGLEASAAVPQTDGGQPGSGGTGFGAPGCGGPDGREGGIASGMPSTTGGGAGGGACGYLRIYGEHTITVPVSPAPSP